MPGEFSYDRLGELLDTRPGQYRSAIVDVEGKCNLRCVYCSQSDKNFKPHDGMGDDVLGLAIEFAKTYGRNHVNVTAEGEFTFAKNWLETARRLLQSGLVVSCTTNMARSLDPDEVDVLSRFTSICVSLDSVDPKTLKEIRRSASIKTISDNIIRINALSDREGRARPEFIVNCVLSNKNALSIVELLSYCYSLGVSYVYVSPLHNYGIFNFDKTQLGDERVEDPVETWDVPELAKLMDELLKAKAFSQRVKRKFTVNLNIVQRLTKRLRSVPLNNHIGEGETRICIQPWERVFIRNNGGVMPCCYGASDIGNIREQSIDDVMRGGALTRLKRSLLTGVGLEPACLNCDGVPIGKVEELAGLVKQYLASVSVPEIGPDGQAQSQGSVSFPL